MRLRPTTARSRSARLVRRRAPLLEAAARATCTRATCSNRRQAEVAKLQQQQRQLEERIEPVDTGHVLVREARRLGLVKPGERLYIVRGIAAWRRATAEPVTRAWRRFGWTTDRDRRAAARAASAGVPARRRALPVRAAGRDRAAAVRRRRARRSRRSSGSRARTSSRSSRGSRPAAASRAGRGRPRTTPSSRASLAEAHAEQRALRPELPVGIGGASRTGSLKCLHAHAAFALARPGYELGDAHPRRGRARSGRGTAAAPLYDPPPDGRRARPAAVGRRAPPGRAGAARVAGVAAARGRDRARRRRSCVAGVGQIVHARASSPRAYDDAVDWARDVALRRPCPRARRRPTPRRSPTRPSSGTRAARVDYRP